MRLELHGGRETEGCSAPSDPAPCRPEEAGAEVPLLPRDALHVLAEQLDEGDLEQALLLLKLFVILCRWVPVVFSTVRECALLGRGGGWLVTGTSPVIHFPGTRRM